MFAEAVLGMERGGVTVAWNICPIFRRRKDIVKGLAGLKELRVKKARQVPTLGSIHQCLSLVQQKYHSRGCDESMCSAALTTTLAPSGAANCTARRVD
jgi:hypothetical protein